MSAQWPQTGSDDWCGEHQPREVAVEKPSVFGRVRESDAFRRPGYYFVRTAPFAAWDVAYWSGVVFCLLGGSTYEHVHEIDERRIERDVSA